MTAILEPDVGQLGIMNAMLHGSVAVTSMPELLEYLEQTPEEYAIVLGPSVAIDEATTFAQRSRITRPDLGVILLRYAVDSDTLSVALRSGMREVVESRDLAGLTTAVHRARSVAKEISQTLEEDARAAAEAAKAELAAASAAAEAAANAPQGRVLTVFSTKGGVGKSLVATNLAVALSGRGKNVCLVDLDVHSGDVAIMLQLSPVRTINDLVAFGGQIDADALSSIFTTHSERLSVVAAPVRLDSPDHAASEDIGAMLDTLKAMFDFVVIDTSGGFDDNALTALDRTDTIVLVGTLDIPALKALKLATGTLDLLNYDRSSWRFVLNRADVKVGLTVDEFESTLGIKADTSLVSSREVLAAVNRGEALVSAFPNHLNSKALVDFAATFTDTEVEPAKKPSRLRLRKA